MSKEDQGSKVDQKLYRGMIGSLLYLTASRPDILFNACVQGFNQILEKPT